MESPRGFLHGIEWIMFHGHLDCVQKLPFGGRLNTNPGDHGTPNVYKFWFILFYQVWRSAWIEIHWNNIWLRVISHMTSQYTWGSMTTLRDFGGVLSWPLNTFIWTLTISRSRLLARVWSGCEWSDDTLSRCHPVTTRKLTRVDDKWCGPHECPLPTRLWLSLKFGS